MAITATKPRVNRAGDTTNNFWWADLQSTDVAASKDFYGRVLGWDFREDTDDAGKVVYHTALIGDVKLAGLGEMMEQAAATGAPSFWTNYVNVTDVDAMLTKVTKLGGTVMMPAMDVMEEGRMAIVVDPTGAAFGLWQPNKHLGADAVNQPSTLAWTELLTTDVEAAKSFYTGLFGWTVELLATPPAANMEYWLLERDGNAIAGLMAKPEQMAQAPNAWITYLAVADVEATAGEVKAAGGNVMWGPMQTGPGRSVGVMDPQGAFVVLMQLDEWPAV